MTWMVVIYLTRDFDIRCLIQFTSLTLNHVDHGLVLLGGGMVLSYLGHFAVISVILLCQAISAHHILHIYMTNALIDLFVCHLDIKNNDLFDLTLFNTKVSKWVKVGLKERNITFLDLLHVYLWAILLHNIFNSHMLLKLRLGIAGPSESERDQALRHMSHSAVVRFIQLLSKLVTIGIHYINFSNFKAVA